MVLLTKAAICWGLRLWGAGDKDCAKPVHHTSALFDDSLPLQVAEVQSLGSGKRQKMSSQNESSTLAHDPTIALPAVSVYGDDAEGGGGSQSGDAEAIGLATGLATGSAMDIRNGNGNGIGNGIGNIVGNGIDPLTPRSRAPIWERLCGIFSAALHC